MSHDIDVLHHIGLVGRDLGRLAGQYERLGFALTPVSVPRFQLSPGADPEPVGAGNRHAILENSYLEVLGVLDRVRWDSIPAEKKGAFDLDRPLSRYEGLHVLHLGTDDIEAAHLRLEKAGLRPSAIRPFQRSVDTETGPQTMRARTFSLPPDCAPEALFQIAQHDTPELVLQPRHMHHANGAKLLEDVIMCVTDVEEAAGRYGIITGHVPSIEGRIRRIRLGRSDIVITDGKGLAELIPDSSAPVLPFLAAFTLVADLGRARGYFQGQQIPTQVVDDMLVIGPTEAGGASIRFRDQDSA